MEEAALQPGENACQPERQDNKNQGGKRLMVAQPYSGSHGGSVALQISRRYITGVIKIFKL
jgi:hypothetical protein